MPWILVVIAGLFEAGWALGLKASDGLSRPLPTVLTLGAILASMLLLGLATRSLPIGPAYGVWVGIGAIGAAIGGAFFFGEALPPAKVFFVILLVVAVIGLKATAGADGAPGTGAPGTPVPAGD